MVEVAHLLVSEIDRILPIARGRNAHAADHLQRSAESALFNVGEGAVAYRPKVKLSVYEIGRRETNEVRVNLRRLESQGVLTFQQIRRAYNLASVLITMLTNAAITIERGMEETDSPPPPSPDPPTPDAH